MFRYVVTGYDDFRNGGAFQGTTDKLFFISADTDKGR